MPKTSIPPNLKDFRAIRIKLASPEDILDWSYGEITKPETINYRTQKPEKEGLFSEAIFGPTKDWECYCGKYRRIRYKGIVCDKCGVEVTRAIVRRERMGHITLASPVSHIWFLRGVPSKMGLLLDLGVQELEKVIYFAAYIIIEVDEEARGRVLEEIEREYKTKQKTQTTKASQRELKSLRDAAVDELAKLKKFQVLSEAQYYALSVKYGEVFKADIGAEAVRKIFEGMDLEELRNEIKAKMEKIDETGDKKKILRRLRLAESLIRNNLRPEWMFISVVPVIPPDLRPMVPLDGGRYATSDVNDLYRRVINRNNRLKKLIDLKSPEVIVRNEKRMLQEAVDALIDNSAHRGSEPTATTAGGGKRALKSLADLLKGKQGRFRQNLLGKRVDYSGRSVIVVGPELKLHQTGLPKRMALEIFKPFVIHKLIYQKEVASNIRNASRLVDEEADIVWESLEEVIADKVILLNRAPTLHRLGIQAFQPILIDGSAIQVHPLVCQAFNADFDGDQMAVHLPLGEEAQREAKEIMLSSRNLLKPATGEAIVDPQKDMVLGIYWMTSEAQSSEALAKEDEEKSKKPYSASTKVGATKGEGKIFGSANEAILAYDFGEVDLRVKIKVRFEKTKGEFVETTVGRILFNRVLPDEVGYINETMTRKKLVRLTSEIIQNFPQERVVRVLDDIKALGFDFSTKSGISWGMDDIIVPPEKEKIINKATTEVEKIREHYFSGLLTLDERKYKSIAIWHKTKEEIAKMVPPTMHKANPVFMIFDSGSRGNISQLTQMAGMKGVVINPAGETIELPIVPSFKEGFNVLEYFISTHGARKGTTDTALKTAAAGYLTRRLVDVAQDVVVREDDCGDTEGVVKHKDDGAEINLSLGERVLGRVLLQDIKDSKGKIIAKNGDLVTRAAAKKIDELVSLEEGLKEIKVRSVLRCKSIKGICAQCFGYDLGSNSLVAIGSAVGIVTAQAIGEPGTQLTMRTFHVGGVAGASDITQGLPRVEEVFEVRPPKGEAVLSQYDGVVEDVVSQGAQKIIRIRVSDKSSPASRKATQDDKVKEYSVPLGVSVLVEKGDLVAKGSQLSEGNLNLQDLFLLSGQEAVERYVVKEVETIYVTQGASINEKYLEVIARQMFSRVRVLEPGDTALLPGEVAEKWTVWEENAKLKKPSSAFAKASADKSAKATEGKVKKATYEQLLLGITKVSLTTDSFLSAASFQETARSLINAAIEAKEDRLRGLKENVIVGRLIPAGTGYRE
ncbi:MAG: DNA-directed RNA polymerase subunit beta' [Parcubacteria group bacterium]|nr:DNA-directed RNA polymerase subunit beta' [Parcubacteria group bacterium]